MRRFSGSSREVVAYENRSTGLFSEYSLRSWWDYYSRVIFDLAAERRRIFGDLLPNFRRIRRQKKKNRTPPLFPQVTQAIPSRGVVSTY